MCDVFEENLIFLIFCVFFLARFQNLKDLKFCVASFGRRTDASRNNVSQSCPVPTVKSSRFDILQKCLDRMIEIIEGPPRKHSC